MMLKQTGGRRARCYCRSDLCPHESEWVGTEIIHSLRRLYSAPLHADIPDFFPPVPLQFNHSFILHNHWR